MSWWWPWAARETRAAEPSDYTSLLLATAYASASGTGSDPSVLGALETAAGFWARAFAAATVTGAPDVIPRAVTPWMLATTARSLIRAGESLWAIEVKGGAVRLEPCAYWDVRGSSPNPATWRIRADRIAPDHSRTDLLPWDRCCLFRYESDPNQPWRGRSPLETARSLSKLASYGEARLGDELSGPVGSVLPWPTDPGTPDGDGDDEVSQLRTQIAALRGSVGVVETTRGGHGLGTEHAPKDDWKLQRIGANPPAGIVNLHSAAAIAVLNACGVPAALCATDATAAALRDAWRLFLFGSVMPIARMVQDELRDKLDAPDLALDFSETRAADVGQRARAFQSLTKGGMETDDAARVAGVQ